MKLFFRGMLMLVISVFMTGCFFSDGEQKIGELPALPNVGSTHDGNEQVITDVYWDATYSMQGYTTVPQQNNYLSLPDNLEDIGTAMGEVNFFRFGEEIQPLEGRQHRQFMNSGCYNEVITAIHKVVENADEQHLSVVVTDLFESDADWSNIAKQIKGKYFDAHHSVAIIGIKSPFKGDIFDVGYSAGAKIFYDSGNDPVKYRPFYMLIMGPDYDVRMFIAKCKERLGTGENVKYLLFSDKLVEQIPDLNTMNLDSTENLFSDSKLDIKDKRLVEFGVNDMDDEANLGVSFDFVPFDDVCRIDTGKLKSIIHVNYLQDGNWVEETDPSKVDVSLEPIQDGTNSFAWSLKFMPRDLIPPDGVMLLEAFVTTDKNGLALPDWVREWNLDNQASFEAGQFDGSKTINLVRLMSSLKDSSMITSIPSIANIFMVIKN